MVYISGSSTDSADNFVGPPAGGRIERKISEEQRIHNWTLLTAKLYRWAVEEPN
jgi:hypothetical protein